MSERIYSWLLRLYPRGFQEEYGAASRQLFRDRWSGERGFGARCRLWLDVLGDLAVSIPREYRRPARPARISGYRLSPEAVAAMAHHGVLPVYGALLLALILGLLGGAPRTPLLIGYALMAGLLTTARVRHKIHARRHLLGLELFLAPDRIERKQPGFDLTLHRSDILRILEGPGGLMVAGPERQMIWVPAGLNGFQQVREHLAAWMPIEPEEPAHHSVRVKPRHAQFFLFPVYVSAVLVRAPWWSAGLALLAAPGLLALLRAALRPPAGARFKPAPVLIILGLAAALIVKNVLLFR